MVLKHVKHADPALFAFQQVPLWPMWLKSHRIVRPVRMMASSPPCWHSAYAQLQDESIHVHARLIVHDDLYSRRLASPFI